MTQDNNSVKIQPNPWVLVLFITSISSSLFVMAAMKTGVGLDEINSISFSTILALICWLFAQKMFPIKEFGFQFILAINLIFLLKIGLNLAHFYYAFAPEAGISSSNKLMYANFTGDSPKIYKATLRFANMANSNGLWYAITGDYYRDINNPGVAIIYGIIYLAFGPYSTAAIPWATLAMGVACLLLCTLGYRFGFNRKLIVKVMVTLFLMPVFFITPPNYRDQFMIFLSVTIVYVSIYAAEGNKLSALLPLIILTPMIGSLRTAYILLPFASTFFAFYSFRKLNKTSNNAKSLFIVFMLIIASISLAFLYSHKLDELGAKVQGGDHNWGPFEKLKRMGGVFYYLGVIPYSLLAPFPWWQYVNPSLLTYQIFNYPQTWLGLIMVFASFLTKQEKEYKKPFYAFRASALFMFFLAIAGSKNLGWSYIQIIMPLLILPAAPILERRGLSYVALSGMILLIMHVIYFLFKM